MDFLRDDAAAHVGIDRSFQVPVTACQVDGVPVRDLKVEYRANLHVEKADCTSARSYGAPGEAATLRATSVQKFDHTVSEMIVAGHMVAMVVDVDRLAVPDNSILHTLQVAFSSVKTVTSYELVGGRRLISQADRIRLEVCG